MLHLTLLSLIASLVAIGAVQDAPSATVTAASQTSMPYGIPADAAERLARFRERAAQQTAAAAGGKALYAAPNGSGASCSEAAPCTVDAALAQARGGDQVLLSSGTYPRQKLVKTAVPATQDKPVVVRPANGATVEVGGIDLRAAGVTLQELRVTSVLYVYPSAIGATLDRLHVDGSGIFLRADGSRLLDSVIEDGSGLDGLQVKNGSGILIQGNTIRRFDQTVGKLHADCLQLFDTRNVVVRGNTLSDCHSSAIIFSPGGGTGTSNVLVESNFVAGCVTAPEALCKGGKALDLREPTATGIVVRNNTFTGTVQVAPSKEFVFDRNIVTYLSRCDSPMTNSIVKSWNTGLCRQPAALGRDGNRQGEVPFLAPKAMDLRVAPSNRSAVQVQPVTAGPSASSLPKAVDIDGRPFSPSTVGASEPVAAAADVLSTGSGR